MAKLNAQQPRGAPSPFDRRLDSPLVALFRRFKLGRPLDAGKGRNGWSVEGGPIGGELRAVAGAVPALLQGIPVHHAAEMSATCGMQMQRAPAVPASRYLLKPAADEASFSLPEPFDGCDFAGR